MDDDYVRDMNDENVNACLEAYPPCPGVDELAAENRLLRDALRRAREDMEGWIGYASEYFQEKWDAAGDLAAIDAALAATEEPDG